MHRRQRSRRRGLCTALLAGAALVAGGLAEGALAADPTDQEQLFVYEVNRARNDPPAWATEVGIDTLTGGDGELADLEGVTPMPPLAINGDLVASSRFHATEMADNNYFAHQSAVTGDWPNKMARDAGYPLWSTLADDANNIESISCGFGEGLSDQTQALNAVKLLIVDEGVPSLGHRIHLLGQGDFYSTFVEAGAGFGQNLSADCRNYWAFHTGLKDTVETFLTGVVYDDANGNDLYDAGEGLAGVTVDVDGTPTTTNAAGGWALAVADGSHTVAASGGGFAGSTQVSVPVSGANREVDFVSGMEGAFVDFMPVPEPASWLGQLAGLGTLGALARRRRAARRRAGGRAAGRA